MPTLHYSQPQHTPRPVTPHQQAMYCQLSRATAMAGGLEAIAAQALDAGEAIPQLDYIASLAAHLTEHLSDLAAAFAELPDNR